ncbi:MAG: hypothetical protein QOG45_1259 [Chloroflexota bacterium]|jgi:hypothetical protein|nr:hypothetical protein [Chloroflexota bacterium]
MQPTPAEVLIGTLAVALACVAGAYALRSGLRPGNRLWLVCATGCLLVVLGVVGQRSFPTADAVSRMGRDQAARLLPGPWDAGVGIPVLGLHVTPVALVGLLLTVAGTSLVLFFDAPPIAPGSRPHALPHLEEDDAV